MQTHQENSEWFNQMARSQHVWHESVEHVAPGFHAEARRLGSRSNAVPRVLDLGAGETGLSTYPYLATGCKVYAVDSADVALQRLKKDAQNLPGELVLCHQDIEMFITEAIKLRDAYDIVVARSFLHHLPDYLGALREISKVIAPQGVFLSYEDPPRYDAMSRFDLYFTRLAYYTHRLFRGNYLRGIQTLWRRLSGKLDESRPEDMVEYHVVRNGVDQAAIKNLFVELGFECRIIEYFTTENPLFKALGRRLNVRNSFAVIASRPAPAA